MANQFSGHWLWWIVGGVIILIAVASKDFLTTLVILGGAEAIAYAVVKRVPGGKEPDAPRIAERNSEQRYERRSSLVESAGTGPQSRTSASSDPLPSVSVRRDEFYSKRRSSNSDSSSYTLPKPPIGLANTRWVPPRESAQVAGVTLPGGMIYVGPRLKATNGDTAPCLINGLLPVAPIGDYRSREMGYWPSYARATPEARRAYLNWLAEGRSSPDCDIGYVFLFFYGLERRIILDSQIDPLAKEDRPAIVEELRRLLAIYGDVSGSFRHYASGLLSWIELDCAPGRLYEKPVPDFPRSYELPFYVRLALGQAAVDGVPLPARLALAWVRLSPEVHLRTAATRCADEFERLFTWRYQQTLDSGLVLRKNRTKLKFVYHAASAGLLGTRTTMDFGGVPDVTPVTAPIKKLAEIANRCTDELGSYSRLLGKDPSLTGSLESLTLLSVEVWPKDAKTKLDALVARTQGGCLTLTLKELIASLGNAQRPLDRNRIRGLAEVLQDVQIGMEPNVLGGARTPAEDDKIILFAQPTTDASGASGPEYQTAALTLQLASALARADGDASAQEIRQLQDKVDGWAQLTIMERCRLHAHVQWLLVNPPTLAGLKRKLEPLDAAAREAISTFTVVLAQADGYVSPDEVKFLQKIYKVLGIDPERVFTDVQAAGTGATAATSRTAEAQGFHLDADRIAALQKNTARVSALLTQIFVEEESPLPEPPPPPEPEPVGSMPLGLDESHATLVRLLLSRPQWARAELEDAAADLHLMLDGALEEINEAAFAAFDAPLCEGDDPIEVDTELLEKMEA